MRPINLIMQLFFLTRLNDQAAQLEADEARHCIKVLRYREGDELHGIDGFGNKYRTTITAIQKHAVTLSILEVLPNWGEHPFQVELAISPLRHRDRLEWAIEKAVELGVTHIYPRPVSQNGQDWPENQSAGSLDLVGPEAKQACSAAHFAATCSTR